MPQTSKPRVTQATAQTSRGSQRSRIASQRIGSCARSFRRNAALPCGVPYRQKRHKDEPVAFAPVVLSCHARGVQTLDAARKVQPRKCWRPSCCQNVVVALGPAVTNRWPGLARLSHGAKFIGFQSAIAQSASGRPATKSRQNSSVPLIVFIASRLIELTSKPTDSEKNKVLQNTSIIRQNSPPDTPPASNVSAS